MADTTDKIIQLREYDLLRTNINKGQWYACTDSRKLYYDETPTTRNIAVVTQIPTEKQRVYENYQKKYGQLYYVWESNVLYIWNDRWEVVKGNPDYPNAYQYIDGDIYAVSNGNYDDVRGNGILGDGSVVIRDVNRIIKAQIYIDESNDNLVIASFLGGGVKILPNGNMERTGALYLNPTTIGEDEDGLGRHFNTFENINGEMYVIYENDITSRDPSKYQKDDHKYLVWHEGNLDATPLIEGWYLLKEIDKTKDGKGKTIIDNSEETNGLSITSENTILDSKVNFSTHAYNGDKSPILAELVGTDNVNADNNAGLYVLKNEKGEIEIHLRQNKKRPTTSEDINSNDKLLTHSEAVELLNEKVYGLNRTLISNTEEIYEINDSTLVPLIKEGLVISVTFDNDTTREKVFLHVLTRDNVEEIDINLDPNYKDRIIGFKMGSIYQLLYTGEKWLLLNPQMKAKYLDNEYGLVRVTGESSDVSSYVVISDSEVDLDSIKYTYDGRYSFINEIKIGTSFPEEEKDVISDGSMQYILDVESSQGRGTSDNINDNSLEQTLTNINSGKKYRRFLNRDWYLKSEFEEGGIDSSGLNEDDPLKVRQKDKIKVHNKLIYRFMFEGLTTLVQVSFIKIKKDGTTEQTSYLNVSSGGVTINVDSNTKYIRMVLKYSDNTTQLNPQLIQDTKILISTLGYTEWQKIYDEDGKTSREKSKFERINLLSTNWKENSGNYEQIIYNWEVTKNTLAEGNLDILNQSKLGVSYIETFDYGYKIISDSLPNEDVEMIVTFTELEEV